MDNLSGQIVKGYELRERIGAGGFGAVYRAYQPSVGREVAIKIILPQFADQPDFIRRFEIEAQVVARLEHAHIVPLYDYWREPGGAYLVMRWLRGGSLRTVLKHELLTPERVADQLDQIASALTVAHRQGIVHRDLKPDNILLDDNGDAYLADFGIAKATGSAPDITQTNGLIGSPAYLSPEQAKGIPVTPLSDQYSLGIMLFELLTGSKPYRDETTVELLHRHLSDPMPHLTAVHPNWSALDAVLQRTTAKNPTDRYPDVMTLANAFREASEAARTSAPAAEVVDLNGPTLGAEAWTPTVPGSVIQESALLRSPNANRAPARPLSVVPPVISNPYKGLRAFQEADAADFFGRETLVARLVTRLGQVDDRDHFGRFLAVVGPSGSGKSSVVRAGLIPALRQNVIPGSNHWFIIEMLPGAHPLEELEIALLRIAVNPPASLLEQLQKDERGLVRAIGRVLPADGSELLLVIDQFEEVFTLLEDEAARAHFLNSLLTAVTELRGRLRVIVTLRADFYDRPLLYSAFGELMRKQTEIVLPLSVDELRQAILSPAERAGLVLEPGLVDAIVRDVGEQPGTLPLLQYALTELVERRQGNTLTQAAYNTSGGVSGALARRADELYLGLEKVGQEAARQLFLRLLTLGEGTEDTRRRVRQTEITTDTGDNLVMEKVIAVFSQYRLLTFDRDPLTRGPTVEVAHEALIRTWIRLRDWLDDSREDLRLHRRLTLAASEWTEANRDPGFLAMDARLHQFENWLQTTTLVLNAEERAYLEASLAERTRRLAQEEARKAREAVVARRAQNFGRAALVLAVVGVLAVIATIAAGVQVNNMNQQVQIANATLTPIPATLTQVANQIQVGNNVIESQSLAALANGVLQDQTKDQEPALLLGIRALKTVYSPQADAALVKAVYTPHTMRQFSGGHTAAVTSVAFSADGHYALTGSADKTARQWDATTGQLLRILNGHTDSVTSVAFSPDGLSILTGSADKTARLWNSINGQLLRVYRGHTDLVTSVAFSPDDHYVLTGSNDGTARLWDVDAATSQVEDTQPVRVLKGHLDIVYSVTFSPDGHYILTGSADKTARLWDITTGQTVHTFAGHTGYVNSVAFSPDGHSILTGSADKTARLWNILTGQTIQIFHGHSNTVNSVAFSPDGHYVLTGSTDTTARLWVVNSGGSQGGSDQTVVRVFSGHTDAVNGVAFSPDGRNILTGSADTASWLWSVADSQIIRILSDIGAMTSVTFSPDGRYALTGSCTQYDPNYNCTLGEARLWDTMTGQPVRTFTGHTNAVFSVAFSPDGHYILTGSLDSTAHLWDVATGQTIQVFSGHTGPVTSVAFSPDGHYVLTGSADKTARLWDVSTGHTVRAFSGHNGGITSVAFSADGHYILTGSADKTARLWDTTIDGQTTMNQPVRIFSGHTSGVSSVAFSPDGRYVLTGSADMTARLWDIASGQTARTFSGHTDIVYSVTFSPDGRYVLTGSKDTTARLWDPATGLTVDILSGQQGGVHGVAFSPDSRFVLSASDDKTTWLWAVAPGLTTFSGQLNIVLSVAFSPNGQFVFTGSCSQIDSVGNCIQGDARLWNAVTGQPVRAFSGPAGIVLSAAFSPDGRFVLASSCGQLDSAGNCIQGDVWLWDVVTGQIVRTFSGHTDTVLSVAFSPDGHYILTGSLDQTARLWNAMTGQLMRIVSNKDIVTSVAFSPDGQSVLVSGFQNTAQLWPVKALTSGSNRTAADSSLQTFSGHSDYVKSVAFSPDGRYVLTGSADNTARLWAVETGQNLRLFIGHTGTVTSVAFSPEGRYVLTGSDDGTARLWDVATGQSVRTFSGHTAAVTSVAFSPDGRYVLTGSRDRTARLWQVDYRDFIAYACTQAWRDFTPAERTLFGLNDQQPTCPQFDLNLPSTPFPSQTPLSASWTPLPVQSVASVIPYPTGTLTANMTYVPYLLSTPSVTAVPITTTFEANTWTPIPTRTIPALTALPVTPSLLLPISSATSLPDVATLPWTPYPSSTPIVPAWTPVASPTAIETRTN